MQRLAEAKHEYQGKIQTHIKSQDLSEEFYSKFKNFEIKDTPTSQFQKELEIIEKIVQNQYYKMTDVQKKIGEKILSKTNIRIEASTGIGKTVGYLAPVLYFCMYENAKCIILVPTRELVLQVTEASNSLIESSAVGIFLIFSL